MPLKFILPLVVILVILFAFFYARSIEESLAFFPDKNIPATPKNYDLQFDDVSINSQEGGLLNGWFIPAKKSRYVVLFCHGNAGNIGTRVEKIKIFHDLGLSLFIFDYRGYGKSPGKPSEIGVQKDTLAAYNYLVNIRGIKPQSILVYGESLGGVFAIDLAVKVEIAGLITEGTFSKGRDMAKILYPLVPALFFSNKLDSLSKIKKVTCPKLLMHSLEDEVVPFELGLKLYDSAPRPKILVELDGGHNDCFFVAKDKYVKAIKDFVGSFK